MIEFYRELIFSYSYNCSRVLIAKGWNMVTEIWLVFRQTRIQVENVIDAIIAKTICIK